MPVTPQDVAQAWHSPTNKWYVRRNKANADHEQYEVCNSEDGEDPTVVAKFGWPSQADEERERRENEERGAAVLRLFGTPQ